MAESEPLLSIGAPPPHPPLLLFRSAWGVGLFSAFRVRAGEAPRGEQTVIQSRRVCLCSSATRRRAETAPRVLVARVGTERLNKQKVCSGREFRPFIIWPLGASREAITSHQLFRLIGLSVGLFPQIKILISLYKVRTIVAGDHT